VIAASCAVVFPVDGMNQTANRVAENWPLMRRRPAGRPERKQH